MKNKLQFAKKNEIVFFGGDKFEIESDFDVNVEKVIAIFLIIDNAFFVDRGIRIPLLSKFFNDGKHRNWQWQPKKKMKKKL